MKNNKPDIELILLDKGPIQSLKNEDLEVVSKHKILVPDIFLIENLKRKETQNKISKLKNTYWIDNSHLLAKDALLGREMTVVQNDLTKIVDDPAELKKHVGLARKAAREYDDFPRRLLQNGIDLSPKSGRERIMNGIKSELKKDRRKMSDNTIKHIESELKQMKTMVTIKYDDWENLSQIIINDLDNKPIREEDRYLKESERTYVCNKEWLDFSCEIFQTTLEEKTQIFKRWEQESHQNLKFFAPYVYYFLALESTTILHIRKSKGSHKREILRDFRYLYYANCPNVTFHTSDRQLKDTIQKIPFLRHIQEKMVYFNNDEVNRPGELNRSDWLKKLEDSHGE